MIKRVELDFKVDIKLIDLDKIQKLASVLLSGFNFVTSELLRIVPSYRVSPFVAGHITLTDANMTVFHSSLLLLRTRELLRFLFTCNLVVLHSVPLHVLLLHPQCLTTSTSEFVPIPI